MPPEPDLPPEWDLYAPASPSLVAIASGIFAGGGGAEDGVSIVEGVVVPVIPVETVEEENAVAGIQVVGVPLMNEGWSPSTVELPVKNIVEALEIPAELVPERLIEPPIMLPPYLISPVPGAGEQVRMITVVLRSSGDKTRDVLRLRRIHGTVMSYPGNDRFAFHVFERNRGYLLEFPNFTTGVCQELISRLQFLVGPDNVRVEPITFQ
jgi:hypothetical protein